MTSDVHIRPFEETDTQAVVALWRASFPDDPPRNDPARIIERRRDIQRDLFMVAVVDATIVGAALGGYDGHRGWVYHVAVSAAHRRRGIGRALMAAIEAELRAAGCPKLNLQVLPTNRAVIDFYERLGYRFEDRISMGKLFENADDPAEQRY